MCDPPFQLSTPAAIQVHHIPKELLIASTSPTQAPPKSTYLSSFSALSNPVFEVAQQLTKGQAPTVQRPRFKHFPPSYRHEWGLGVWGRERSRVCIASFKDPAAVGTRNSLKNSGAIYQVAFRALPFQCCCGDVCCCYVPVSRVKPLTLWRPQHNNGSSRN